MKIGLFFGSFNPIHSGHLAIASYLNTKNLFREIWVVVSPNNPLKNNNDLIDEDIRLEMVKLAIKDFPYLCACDAEFYLPKPSYTINTLNYLENLYHNYQFSLILGEDNLVNFTLWKDYEEILERYIVYVYPRSVNLVENNVSHPHIVRINAPLLPVSATEVRAMLKNDKTAENYLPAIIIQYIREKQLYH
jgi:nicotinate-nucleotide adenylyltransferase